MPMLRTIERPTKATLRPCAWAASRTCWMRCTWLAKLETMTRRGAVRKTCSIAGVRSRSEVVKPGTSALVESVRNRSTPSSPSRAKARRSVIRSSSGNWSILKSPVCSTRPAAVRIATARPSGIEWLTATNSQSNGPKLRRSPSAHLAPCAGLIPCSLSLASRNASVSLRADDRDVGPLAQQVRHAADVVLVAVGEHDAPSISSSRSRIEVKSGRITSTPGWCLLGEQHAAVDDQQLAGVLEDGHVAADLAQAAQGDDPQAVLRAARRRRSVQVRVAHDPHATGGRPGPSDRGCPAARHLPSDDPACDPCDWCDRCVDS